MPDRNESSSRKIEPSIVAALIGGAVTIIVTLISVFASRPAPQPTPTMPGPIIVTPTSAPNVEPTFTLMPPPTEEKPTSIATATDAPVVVPTNTAVPIVAGQDWQSGCINSTVWRAYPDTVNQVGQDGCIVEPVAGMFTTSKGHLYLQYDKRADLGTVYGLFTHLPQEGNASITVDMDDLGDLYGELWIGIFSKPTIESDGMLITIPPGTPEKGTNFIKYVFIQKNMPGLVKNQGTSYYLLFPAIYRFSFDLKKSSIHTKIDTSYPWNEYTTSFTDKWLFIGYQTKNGTNKLKADFYDLSITQ